MNTGIANPPVTTTLTNLFVDLFLVPGFEAISQDQKVVFLAANRMITTTAIRNNTTLMARPIVEM